MGSQVLMLANYPLVSMYGYNNYEQNKGFYLTNQLSEQEPNKGARKTNKTIWH